jgi:hypothetical protein
MFKFKSWSVMDYILFDNQRSSLLPFHNKLSGVMVNKTTLEHITKTTKE